MSDIILVKVKQDISWIDSYREVVGGEECPEGDNWRQEDEDWVHPY